MLGRERITRARLAGICLAAAGVLYLIGPDQITFSPEQTLGNAMIATNAASYALYLVLSKPILERYDSLTVLSWIFAFGALFVAPFGIAAFASPGALDGLSPSVLAAVAFIVLVATVGTYWLNTWALECVRPSVVAIYIYLQPLLTGVLAVWLLGETLNSRLLPSAALIFAGVALATLRLRAR